MYKKTIYGKSELEINESSQGETIEQKVERIVNNNEGIEDGSPAIYTERSMGVMAEYDIRTDKWDLAIDAMSKAHEVDLNKRQTSIQERKEALEAKKNSEKPKENGGEISGTDGVVAQ